MEQINKEQFLALAKPVLETSYFESLEWEGYELQEIVENWESDSEEEYEYDEVMSAVERVVYGDQTAEFPEALSHLADYLYGIAIEKKDGNRINDYGTFYYMGRNGKQDFEKAAYYYQMASDLGCPYSIENLGYIYYYGRTGEINYEKAFLQFAKGSAVFNRACSTYKLGDMYKNGYFVTKDIKSAFACYQRAEKLIDNGKDENRAENVAPDIYFRLAEAYHYGYGTEEDLKQALSYYQKAEQGFIVKIEQGDFLIKNMLTQSIDKQEEVRAKIAENLPAMKWAKKAKD